VEMTPCEAEPCPVYGASGPFRYAVEVPLGDFDWLSETARISVKG
jgi:uncharacterized membrane protein (UPF0127 family)